MKPMSQRHWSDNRTVWRPRIILNPTTALIGLTLVLFSYIVFHVIYPLLAKGLLW